MHENPVKAKIVDRCEDYDYSSAYKYLNGKNDAIDQTGGHKVRPYEISYYQAKHNLCVRGYTKGWTITFLLTILVING